MSVQSRHRAAPQQQAGGCRPPEDTTACASAAFSSLQYVVPAPEARKPTSFSSPTCAYFHLTRRDLALASPGVRAGCPHHRTEPPNPSRKASFDTGFPPSVLSGWRSTQSSRVLGTGTLSRDTTSPPMPRQPCPGFSQSPSPETSLSRGKNSSECAVSPKANGIWIEKPKEPFPQQSDTTLLLQSPNAAQRRAACRSPSRRQHKAAPLAYTNLTSTRGPFPAPHNSVRAGGRGAESGRAATTPGAYTVWEKLRERR